MLFSLVSSNVFGFTAAPIVHKITILIALINFEYLENIPYRSAIKALGVHEKYSLKILGRPSVKLFNKSKTNPQ